MGTMGLPIVGSIARVEEACAWTTKGATKLECGSGCGLFAAYCFTLSGRSLLTQDNLMSSQERGEEKLKWSKFSLVDAKSEESSDH